MIDTQLDTARTKIRDRILNDYLFSENPEDLKDDQSFRETRIIDSMGMAELITFIETEFSIKVQDDEMVPEKLDSVDRLVSFVTDKKGLR